MVILPRLHGLIHLKRDDPPAAAVPPAGPGRGFLESRPFNNQRSHCAPQPMPYTLSHKVLDQVLQKHRVAPNDLAGIDRLFGGADGYYWYHTMRHLCSRDGLVAWESQAEMGAALQAYENETAAEDEVKPQVLKEEHLAAIARLLDAAA
jgi:hypothetical protein